MPIDAWMQHPTQRFLANDMFAPLLRWTGQNIPHEEPPIAATRLGRLASCRPSS